MRGTVRQKRAEPSRRNHHGAEHRERQQFRQRPGRAEHERGAKRDEIAGDMRGEQSLQGKEARGIDEARIEAEHQRQHGAKRRWKHDRRSDRRGVQPLQVYRSAAVLATSGFRLATGRLTPPSRRNRARPRSFSDRRPESALPKRARDRGHGPSSPWRSRRNARPACAVRARTWTWT